MVLTNVIRRGGVLIAAAVMIPFVALAASGCGAGTSTGDGLESRSPAGVLQAAATALRAAKSFSVTGSAGNGLLGYDLRIKGESLRIKGETLRIKGESQTITLTLTGGSSEITRIGNDTYLSVHSGGQRYALSGVGSQGHPARAAWMASMGRIP
jgi:hypothetical protein